MKKTDEERVPCDPGLSTAEWATCFSLLQFQSCCIAYMCCYTTHPILREMDKYSREGSQKSLLVLIGMINYCIQ